MKDSPPFWRNENRCLKESKKTPNPFLLEAILFTLVTVCVGGKTTQTISIALIKYAPLRKRDWGGGEHMRGKNLNPQICPFQAIIADQVERIHETDGDYSSFIMTLDSCDRFSSNTSRIVRAILLMIMGLIRNSRIPMALASSFVITSL